MHSQIVSRFVAVMRQVEDQRLWLAVPADGSDGVVRGENGQGIVEPRIAVGEQVQRSGSARRGSKREPAGSNRLLVTGDALLALLFDLLSVKACLFSAREIVGGIEHVGHE